MPTQLNPYLSFRDNAREAMEFYQSVLGGELRVMTFGDMGEQGEIKDLVMHSSLHTDEGYDLFGSDTPPGMEFGGTDATICISGDDQELLRGYWEKLSDGAQIVTPLERQPWGDDYGLLRDRYGVSWMVDIATEESMQ